MRSLVMRALSRPRETSRRSVFMLTGTTSCTIGSTKAPPFMTTFWPPRPVRTKARSLDERRYSQFMSQTTMTTTIAATTRPRITAPSCAPVMSRPPVVLLTLAPDAFEPLGRLGQGHLGGQPLHAGGAGKAVAPPAIAQDVARVRRARDGPDVAEHDDVGVHRAGRLGPGVDLAHAVLERYRGLRADGTARGEPEMADHDVGARLGHVPCGLLGEDVRRRQQVEGARGSDHLDLEGVAHARLLELGTDRAVEEAHGGEVLHTGEAQRGQPRQEVVEDHEGVGAVDARQYRRLLHHGQHLARHVNHDVVGVAVRHEAGWRAPAGHAVASRVVDHDEVDATGLLALGREPRPRPAADDGLATADHPAETLQDVCSGHAGHCFSAPP